ncbi:sensor histidine kinase [Clostridium pasteurianum]|uniref:histidine kinase n=1 Tax=Clostridium pasteurianum BC1 TaxID=86416 RepID=R4K8R6_CLOPA|nr:HAMP domain-containing sensor histidine kinase [Clostridium pasteurianum]AGK96010.1 signal transduction histidine kinase [Clostridium pasteurianum BC1]
MLKIRNRIALLYSLLTIVLIIICIILFYCFLKININRQPIISSLIFNKNLPIQTESVTAKKPSKNLDASGKNSNVIILKEGQKNVNNNSNVDNIDNSSSSIQLTGQNFENIFMNTLYNRFIIIILIVIAIILVINFILSRQYASFALKPLIEFTGKVKNQGNFKTIELIRPSKTKDEIYDLTVAYNEALSKIKLSYENLQRLNSYASHELRNSLAVLRAKIEIGEDTKEIAQYIDGLNGVITDILAMSTFSLSNNKESVDLALVCAKIVDEYTVIFNNIKFNMPEEGVETIKGKEIWIERCIANLIDNAMKFVDENKTSNEINIQVSENDTNIIVEVYDNGIGIDEFKFDEIFTPYYGTKSRTSTGIGLAYVKHVMDLHKGRVLVESKKGEYSKFSLVFIK